MDNKLKRVLSVILIIAMIAVLIAGCGKKKATTQQETTENTVETKGGTDQPTEITLNLHYLREDNTYTGWNVWLWSTGDGAEYKFGEEIDDNGVVTTAKFAAGTAQIGFIVRLNEWEAKDIEDDRIIDTSSILAGTVDVYVKSGEAEFKTVFADDCIKGTGVSSAGVGGGY